MNRKYITDEHIDKALAEQPEFELSQDFTEKVIRKIEEKKQAEEKQSGYILIASILGFLLISGVCLRIFLQPHTLKQIMDVSGWGVIIGLLVVIVQILDKKIVKKRTSLV